MKKLNFKFKKASAVLLAVVMLLTAFPLASFALTTDNGLEYTTANGEVTITRYAGSDEVVTVPDAINGNPVTAIGDGAFANPNETRPKKVSLPVTIRKIGMMAFFGSTDTEINLMELENLTYIGAYAFVDTGLSGDLVLPESVTEIGAGAFALTDITSLHLGKNVKPVSVQTGKPWHTLVKTVMPGYAAIVDRVLGSYSSTESERNIAMNCMNLSRITVDVRNPYLRSYGGVLFNKAMTEMYCYPSGKQMNTYIIPLTVRDFYNSFGGLHMPPASFSIFGNNFDLMDSDGNGIFSLSYGWTDFGSNNPLKSVVIPAGVTSICKAAFYNTGLESIYIPKNVTTIGEKAFWHCRSLVTVGFDRNSAYTELPEQCFKDCESLKNVTFGKVDYLAKLAFGNCSTMESIDMTNVLSLDSTAFDDCTSLSEVVYRDTDDTVSAEPYALNQFKASAANGAGDTQRATVSASAFENMPSLKTVLLGSSVKRIEARAFADCSNLTTAYISDEIEDIADTAFDGCGNLTIVCPSETCYAYKYAVKNNIPVTTMVVSPIPNQTYTGSAIEPEFTVTASGRKLAKGTDYEVFYKNNVDAGTAAVTVLGKGVYSMFASVCKFAIVQRNLQDNVLVSNIEQQSADGTRVEPEVALTCGSYVLQRDIDYTVSYENNVNPGTACMTITGIGNFTGTKTLEFEIVDVPDTEVPVYDPGDLDGDGCIALTDYALIKSAAIGMTELSDAAYAAADLNGDTVVDVFDVALLDLMLNQLI